MTNEYEMQNFWRFEVQNVKEEKKEDENYCFYSDLPSPMAYIELEEEIKD